MSNCAEFDSSFLEDLQSLSSDILCCLQAGGVATYGFHNVELVKELTVGGSSLAGIAGEKKQQRDQMQPRPKVELNTRFILENDIIQKIGTAKLTLIPATYTREQLEGADFWAIDKSEYDLVQGGLTLKPSGVFWEANLIRRKKNNKVAP